jgi:hypothetical protein
MRAPSAAASFTQTTSSATIFATGEGAETAIRSGDHPLPVTDRRHGLLEPPSDKFWMLDKIRDGGAFAVGGGGPWPNDRPGILSIRSDQSARRRAVQSATGSPLLMSV